MRYSFMSSPTVLWKEEGSHDTKKTPLTETSELWIGPIDERRQG